MKPSYWICCAALFLKRCPVLHSKTSPHSRGGFCTRLSLLACGQSIQCCSQRSEQLASHRRASTMSSPEFDYTQYNVRCLKDVGLEPMDVVVAGQRHEAKEHVIFFGGDVQDYPENMQSHRDNGKYVRWNTLSTAARLCHRFPTAMVMVVKPHHMHLKTFSVYSQFVQSNDFGCPTHSPDFGAWQRLGEVYTEAVGTVLGPARDAPSGSNAQRDASASKSVGVTSDSGGTGDSEGSVSLTNQPAEGSTESSSGGNLLSGNSANRGSASHIPNVPVHLIGFSKGCIVLNQLVHELENVKNKDNVQNFLSRVQTMTWLDGGHSGGSNTWVTDQVVLNQLAALNVDIHVHVTPYQMKDQMRRWIEKEKRKFVELLQKAGAKVTDTLHFDDEPKSIENHFRVLEVF